MIFAVFRSLFFSSIYVYLVNLHMILLFIFIYYLLLEPYSFYLLPYFLDIFITFI